MEIKEKGMFAKKWYMISTISGKESRVVEDIKKRVISEELEADFEDYRVFLVPYISDKELEKKNKKEEYKIKDKNLYTGYIFIKLLMTDKAWYLIRNTQNVTGLIGSSGSGTKPMPISRKTFKIMEDKYKRLLKNSSPEEINFLLFSKLKPLDIVIFKKEDQEYDAKIVQINREDGKLLIEYIYGEKKVTELVNMNQITKN